VNEAALLAARANKRVVTMAEFEDAKDKVMMGAERRSMVMTDDEKKLTAYHEAGHALVGCTVPKARSAAQGDDHPARPRAGRDDALPEREAMTYGGRIAEELVFGKENITTGAGSDIQQATRIARAMITQFGFSDKLGPQLYTDNEEEVFLGHSVARQKHVSDATAEMIDDEVRRLIDEAQETARRILTEKRDELDKLAEALLEYETLSGSEVDAVIKGEPIYRPDADDDDTGASPEGGGRRSSVPSAGSRHKDAKDGGGGGFGPKPQPEG
jgi:cell division protease FtsH